MTLVSCDLDPGTLLETARILAVSTPTDALDGVRVSLEYLHHADRAITPEALRDIAPCDLSDSEAENIVFQLAVEGIIDEEKIQTETLRTVFTGAHLVAAQDEPPENTIVATIPYDDPALDSGMFEPLHGNLLDLIRSADDELVLMSPYLSEQAYKRLRPALHTATDNGAAITLVTRSLTYGDDEYNRQFVHAVRDDNNLAPHTTCYEYINNETWTTFHAKIVIADGERAYLGTANLTHRGLGDNLELGVIFCDEVASRLAALVGSLRQSEFFHEVAASGDSFYRR